MTNEIPISQYKTNNNHCHWKPNLNFSQKGVPGIEPCRSVLFDGDCGPILLKGSPNKTTMSIGVRKDGNCVKYTYFTKKGEYVVAYDFDNDGNIDKYNITKDKAGSKTYETYVNPKDNGQDNFQEEGKHNRAWYDIRGWFK